MKKLIKCLIVLLTVVFTGCNKQTNNTPATPSTSSQTNTCQSSTWKYEVKLANPCNMGAFYIEYRDGFGNQLIDTTITSTWTKSFTSNLTPLYTWIGVMPGDNYITHIPANTNLTNQITVNIYRDNNIVQTTGGPLPFCVWNPLNTNGPCPGNSLEYIVKTHQCVP